MVKLTALFTVTVTAFKKCRYESPPYVVASGTKSRLQDFNILQHAA
jgi:hypothetical protein